MKSRETTAQWDDLPPDARIVGKRRPPEGGLEVGDALQRLAHEMAEGRVTWPKGVWRFRTHEEADAWWTDQMQIRKKDALDQNFLVALMRQRGETPPETE